MPKDNILVINGQAYDTETGLPIRAAGVAPTNRKKLITPSAVRAAANASSVHGMPQQRSHTLNRKIAVTKTTIKKPAAPRMMGMMDVARHPLVRRAAPIAATAFHPPAKKPAETVKPVVPHPAVARAATRPTLVKRPSLNAYKPVLNPVAKKSLSSKEIKENKISEALQKPTAKAKAVKKKNWLTKHPKLSWTLGAVIAVILIAGSVIWANLAPLSVSIAAFRAGVNADYPGFVPDGYSLEQPVNFDNGKVTLNFKLNGGGDGFSVQQEKSSWDSTAVLDNIVKTAVGDNYTTTQDGGLTIYSYNGNAAWVNGGVFYKITNYSHLSDDQVDKISSSL